MVDLVGWVSLLLVVLVIKIVYGEDFLVVVGIDWKFYVKLIGECLYVLKVVVDCKVD